MAKNDYSPVKVDRTNETFNKYIDSKTDYVGPVYLDLGHKQLEFKNVKEFFSSYGKKYSIDGELTNESNDSTNNDINENLEILNKIEKKSKKRKKSMTDDNDFATVDSRDNKIEQLEKELALLKKRMMVKATPEISTFDDYAEVDYKPIQQKKEKLVKNNIKISFKIGDSKWKLDSRFGFLINDSNSRLFVLGYDSTDNSDRISFDEETPDIRIIGDFGEVVTTYIGSFTAGDVSYLIFLKNK